MGALGDARSAQLGAAGRGGGGRRRRRDRAGACSGSAAGTARASSSRANLLELAERTLQDIAEEARRILPER